MKKLIALMALTLSMTGCEIETVAPDATGEDTGAEAEVVEVEVPFETRTVTASYINIEAERLNVREDADVESERVDAVYENEKFQVLGDKLDNQKRIWYQIETESGFVGYVAGWFCAQTEITILVEEEQTTIVDIEALPVPKYIDNPFDEDALSAGDQVVGLVVKEISESAGLNKIVFSGEVELTGTYYHKTTNSNGVVVEFVPDEASSVLLPRYTNDISSVKFIISDYASVANEFGDVGSEGEATIVIDDYTIEYGTSDAMNEASMISVSVD